jgi:hypothetical protein
MAESECGELPSDVRKPPAGSEEITFQSIREIGMEWMDG